jgi:acetoin utilization deacetylase AcuC-like enzyme
MNKTALVYHKDYLKHSTGSHHPESRERLIAIMDEFRQMRVLEKVDVLTPGSCSDEDILRVHAPEHLEYIRKLSESGGGPIDADTYCREDTYDIARLAAGGGILAGRYVVEGKTDNAFALIRPPGHHATRKRAMGFCYFNNVAITVRYLQENYNVKKACIFDWDVHAANGTMDVFYDDPSVLNVSIHQDPRTIYPGTGFIDQIGEGEGEGYTINIPVPPGTGDADYIHLLDDFILPRIEKFKPDFMAVSAGFDSHRADPLGSLSLTEKGYFKMISSLLELAENLCRGRLVVELEGGYNTDVLATSSYVVVKALLGLDSEIEIEGKASESIKDLALVLDKKFNALW